MQPLRPALLPAVLLLVLGCAGARNYPEPDRPRFEGRHAAGGRADSLLRVVTYNVQFARHIEAAIAVLAGTPELRHLDVLALQEMDEAGAERIGRALGLNYVYYPSAVHPASGRNFGNAILTPWRILDRRKLLLPHQSRTNNLARAAVVATLEVEGRRLRVYNVHFETALGLDDAERRDQVRAVIADAATASDPVIIAGDFNSITLAAAVEAAGFQWPTERVGPTLLLFSWDHVLVRGLALKNAAAAGVARDRHGASDHRPVWVELCPRWPGYPAARPMSSS